MRARVVVWAIVGALLFAVGCGVDRSGNRLADESTRATRAASTSVPLVWGEQQFAGVGPGQHAISGDVAVVGGTVFERTGTTWTIVQQNLGGFSFFGSVAVSNGVIAMIDPSGTVPGLLFFTRTANAGWTLQQTLTNGLPGYLGTISMSGTHLVAGGSGFAVMIESQGGTWSVVQTLTSPVPFEYQYGMAVSASGDSVVVSDPALGSTDDAGNYDYGAVYIYDRQTDGSWAQAGDPLLEPIGVVGYAGDNFANSLALSGNLLLVGAQDANATGGGGTFFQGAAYLYARAADGTWGPGQTILPTNAGPNDEFGDFVGISGTTMAISAPCANGMPPEYEGTGVVYAITPLGSTFAQQKLVPAAGDDLDFTTVAVDGNTILFSSNNGTYFFTGSETSGGSCQSSADCVSGYCVAGVCCASACNAQCESCATGNCVPVKNAQDPVNGCNGAQTCNDQGVCICANATLGGVCCNSACAGPCKTCAPAGTCTPITSADDVGGGCTGAMTCGATGGCGLKNGQAASSASTCASGFLSDGVCCDAACEDPCDVCAASLGAIADGTCSPAPAGHGGSPSCLNGLACGGSSSRCPTGSCASDTACPPGNYCASNGACKIQKSQGSTCNTAATADCQQAGCHECESGFCTDGVCCASWACPTCETCAAALQAPKGQAGVCSPTLAGSDPRDECSPSPGFPDDCMADGLCDGLGACRTHAPAMVACGPTACAAGQLVGRICDGNGVCSSGAVAQCAPYACAGAACAGPCNTDGDCAANAYCTPTHACRIRASVGATCTSNEQCAPYTGALATLTSGVCVDGFCCDSPCAADCEACDVAGHEGTCSLVSSGPPHGTRAACAAAGTACGGACGGTSAQCAYPPPSTPCGSSCEASSAMLTASACDGAGSCVAGRAASCPGQFGCASATSCNTGCTTNADCRPGSTCGADHTCSPSPHCSDDGQSAIDADGGVSGCAPYVCESATGTCQTSCVSQRDCSGTNLCAPSGKCVPDEPSSSSSREGCSAAPGAFGAAHLRWAYALATVCALWARRRRRLALAA